MNVILWLLLASLGLATSSEILKRRRAKNLPDISDEGFLRIYKRKFADPDAIVLEERRSIASHIGLPARKLSPAHVFKELSKYTGFVGEYEVGMGDLESERMELCERAGVEKPSPFPATVGELIHEVVKAKLAKDGL